MKFLFTNFVFVQVRNFFPVRKVGIPKFHAFEWLFYANFTRLTVRIRIWPLTYSGVPYSTITILYEYGCTARSWPTYPIHSFITLLAGEYAAQFYQFAQSQPGSVSVPLYNPNQLPFCAVPSVYFPHSRQPAAPASTPVSVPGQPQLCSSTPSSEDVLHNQPNQQQQPFVVPVQQLNYCTNQPLYKPGQTGSAIMNLNDCIIFLLMEFSRLHELTGIPLFLSFYTEWIKNAEFAVGEPLHASTPLNGSEWGQSEKDFTQKSTASSVQQNNEQNGQAEEGGQTETCNDASGNCTKLVKLLEFLLATQERRSQMMNVTRINSQY